MADIFDREGALERVDGDTELLLELVEICRDEYNRKLPEVTSAVEARQHKQVYELAHSLKSAFGNVGAVRVYAVAKDLEFAGRKETADDYAPLLAALTGSVEEFWARFAEVKDSL